MGNASDRKKYDDSIGEDQIDKILAEEQRQVLPHVKIRERLFQISYDDIRVTRSLGRGGSHSEIFLAEWNGVKVAFKAFKLNSFEQQADMDEFCKEVELMASFRHPNIVTVRRLPVSSDFFLQFYGATLRPPRLGILMEFCKNGPIHDFVRRGEEEPDEYPKVSMSDRIRLLRETAGGMAYLHSHNVIHRDLKPENVLVNGHNTAKIIDFGLSRLFDRMNQSKTANVGTAKVDVYSFGIMMAVILEGRKEPYAREDCGGGRIELMSAKDPEFRPKVPHEAEFPSWVVETMKKCWSHEAKDRPSFEELVTVFSGATKDES